jgi:RHS repeat-associated protein
MSESRTDSYGYNARGEVTSATKQGGQPPSTAALEHTYQYDGIGNRLTSLDLGFSRVYASNGLNQYTDVAESPSANAPQGAVEEFEPLYDDDGNQTLVKTATGVWSVLYNGENRPVLWTRASDGATVSMAFDRMGRRVRCHETGGAAAGSVMTFAYDGYVCVARRRHGTGGAFDVDRFVWDPAEPVATRPLAFCMADSAPQYYAHDGNKNVSELVSADGAVTAHYEYAPFGAVTYSAGSSAVSNPYRFSSEYADSSLALVYYNYRHYEPVTGRWLSRDALEDVNSDDNLYAYCRNEGFVVDSLGLISLNDLAVGALSGNFSSEFSYPIGPGAIVFTASVNANVTECCNKGTMRMNMLLSGSITLELFYRVGGNLPGNKKFKGHDRNVKVLHPCKSGQMINLKRFNEELAKCKKGRRNPLKNMNFTAGSQKCKYCPADGEWWEIKGAIFLRIKAGIGMGVELSGRYTLEPNQPLWSWDNFEGSRSATWVVGASVEAGGAITAEFYIPRF